VGLASPQEIDLYGIVPATRLAAARALRQVPSPPEHLLLDYLKLPDDPTPQTWLVKGDRRSLSIAAASIIAKTYRDSLLEALAQHYPGYGFEANKGYGTASHRQAIHEYGPCPQHRMSFAPMREME
jgi:ribonuclease HII